MKFGDIRFAVGLGILAIAGASLLLRYCHRKVMHIDENEFITRVCDNAVDKPISPNLARALLVTTTENAGAYEQSWLTCIADEESACPSPPSLKIDHGIFSALPQRYWVDVVVDKGIVKTCKVSPAPGW